MGEIIAVASGKGGVGKTVTVAGLGQALAKKDKKVLLVDVDFGLRNLDIALGVENEVVFDVLDCIDNRCNLNDALIKIPDFDDKLLFLPASQSRGGKYIDEEKFREFFSSLKDEFDFVIVDCPAGLGLEMVASCVDKAIIVVLPYISAIRDADRCIDMFEKNNVEDSKLLINAMRYELVESKVMWNADDIMDLLGIEVIGIVPYDEEVLKGSKADKTSFAYTAFENISSRILGESVPIMNIKKMKKKKTRSLFSVFKKK